MLRSWSTLTGLALAGFAAHAQSAPPPILVEAARCLWAKGFLRTPHDQRFDLAYVVDHKSYAGETVQYVVSYAKKKEFNGDVFAVFVSSKDKFRTFDIHNNATFVRRKDAYYGVDFVDPPLGGVWTQRHLSLAI